MVEQLILTSGNMSGHATTYLCGSESMATMLRTLAVYGAHISLEQRLRVACETSVCESTSLTAFGTEYWKAVCDHRTPP